MKIKLDTIWGLHVDPYQSSNFSTAKVHGQLQTQRTLDHRSGQQDLGLSLWYSRVDTTELHETPRKQYDEVLAQ